MSLRSKALNLGASDFKVSNRATKKYAVKYNDKWIHFGAKGYEDFTTHKDEARRQNYRKRHGAIKKKDGSLAKDDKNSPSYWAWHLLW